MYRRDADEVLFDRHSVGICVIIEIDYITSHPVVCATSQIHSPVKDIAVPPGA